MEDEIRRLLEAGGRREAFELLLELYQGRVFRMAYGILWDHAAAEDAAQDVFLRLWKALPAYDGRAAFSTWLFTIARNTCLTLASRQRKVVVVPLGEHDAPVQAETREDVRALVRRLPENYRLALTLFYLEEKSYEETAALLDIPVGTLKSHIHRAKRLLARHLTGKEQLV